jgi:phenylacetate-CoA ligase
MDREERRRLQAEAAIRMFRFAYENSPECGRTEAKIVRILGRVDSMTKVRGIFVHPKLAEKVVDRYPEFGRCQIVVEMPRALDEMTVRLECLMPVEELAGMNDKLAREMKETLRIDTNVEFVEKGSIPDNGKVLLDKRQY